MSRLFDGVDVAIDEAVASIKPNTLNSEARTNLRKMLFFMYIKGFSDGVHVSKFTTAELLGDLETEAVQEIKSFNLGDL